MDVSMSKISYLADQHECGYTKKDV